MKEYSHNSHNYLAHPHSSYGEGYVFRVSVLLLTGGGGGFRESALLAHCCYKSAQCHGGVSGKVDSEHIVATKVLNAMGVGKVLNAMGGVFGKVHSEHILLQKCSCSWGGGVSGKVHSEHIIATKVLMPVWGVGFPGK